MKHIRPALASLAFVVAAWPGTAPIAWAASPATVSMPPTMCGPAAALASATIATVAGTGEVGASGDGGPALSASIAPVFGSVAVDPIGVIYLADALGIRRIDTAGQITTVPGPTADGGFTQATGVALGPGGELYASDPNGGHIWQRAPSGDWRIIAGTGVPGSSGDGGPALDAQVSALQVAVGPDGSLYLDGDGGYRRIDPAGVIHNFAGTDTGGSSGDGGPATLAQFGPEVQGVAVDAAGDVYLGDSGNHRVRKVDTAGIITTVAGTGEAGFSGDGGPATAAALVRPVTIATDAAGDVLVADRATNSVRRIDPSGTITTIAGTGKRGFSGDCGPASAAALNTPYGIAEHDGTVYISDGGNYRLRVIMH